MQIALDDPDWVPALVVADIAPVRYAPRHDAVFAALRLIEQEQPATRSIARKLMHSVLEEPGVADFLALSLEMRDDRLMWRFNLDVLESRYLDVLEPPRASQAYRNATLFLKGENSPYILPEHLAVIRRDFPQGRVHQLAGTGHWLHAEKPQIFNRLVMAFLAQHSRT
jgi:esterase